MKFTNLFNKIKNMFFEEDNNYENSTVINKMKPKKIAVASALLVILSITVITLLSITKNLNMDNNINNSQVNKKVTSTKKQEGTNTTKENSNTSQTLTKINTTINNIATEITKKTNEIINDLEKNSFIDLEKNSNHIKSASAYAYDTKLIRDYMTGKVPYTGEKLMFLTFDDGPNHTISPKILDVLKEKQVHATFFVVGAFSNDETKDVLIRELKEGHSIALHSFTHNYDLLYPGRFGNANRIEKECIDTNSRLKSLIGENFFSHVWRYPGGHMSWKNLKDADNRLKSHGIHWMDWNSLCGDAEPKRRRPTTTQGMLEFSKMSLAQSANPNVCILLCHDAENKKLTLEALPSIIDHFKKEGYKFCILK